MKQFIISSEVLATALKKLTLGINNKSPLPALMYVYCKVNETEVELITSDLETTVMVRCSCEATHSFEVLLPFDYIKKLVSLLGDQPLKIVLNGNKVSIKGANDVHELGGLAKVKDYPNLPEMPKQKFVRVNGSFINWLAKAQATCSQDEDRPAITSICIDLQGNGRMTMVSTDAVSMFAHDFEVECTEHDQLLISPKIAKALDGFDETEIYWRKHHIGFVCGNTTIIATRHEDKFPDYQSVIPTAEHNLVIDKRALEGALQRACLNTDSLKTTRMFLKNEPGTVQLQYIDETLNRAGKIDIPGSYKGDTEKVVINAAKMLQLLHQVDFEQIRLSIYDPRKAILITSETDPGYRAIIVPLQENC